MKDTKTFKSFVFLFIFIFEFQQSFCQSTNNGIKQKLASITVFQFEPIDINPLDSSKFEYIYDSKGNMSSKLSYSWDRNKDEWSIPYKEEFNRDDSGILHSKFRFSDNVGYLSHQRNSFSYDQNGNLLLEINSLWNTSNKLWMNISKKENSYNGNNQLIVQKNFSWNDTNQNWVATKMTENDYDSKKNHILSILFLWNTTLNKFDSSQKLEWSFDKSNYLARHKISQWSNASNEWLLDVHGEYSYNGLGELVLFKSGRRNMTNSFFDSTLLTYKYDANSNLIEFKQQYWDSLHKEWVNLYKSSFLYNIGIESADVILPPDLRVYGYPTYRNQMTEKLEFDWNPKNSSWITKNLAKFNYSNFVAMGKGDNGVLIFPNPTTGKVFVEVEKHPGKITLNLYDISGKLVMTNISYSSSFMDISNLSKGLYTLGVYENNNLISKYKILLKD